MQISIFSVHRIKYLKLISQPLLKNLTCDNLQIFLFVDVQIIISNI